MAHLLALVVSPAIAQTTTFVGETNDPASQMVSRNEDTKAELYFYIEYKPLTWQQEARINVQTYTSVDGAESYPTPTSHWTQKMVELGRATAPDANTWLVSAVTKLEREIVTGHAYLTPAITATNVERYKIHVVAPSGCDIYYRVAGTTGSFQRGSILESVPGSGVNFEVVAAPVSLAGALPGKATPLGAGDARMAVSLGFLPNGKSAGYVDFLPRIVCYKDFTPPPSVVYDGTWDRSWKIWPVYGRSLSLADLNCVSLSEEVEVITLTVPAIAGGYQPATTGLRQVIAPQSVMDVAMDNYDMIIKCYLPSQKGSRITTEGAMTYADGKGPFAMSGDPFATYRIQWSTTGWAKSTGPAGKQWFQSTTNFTITRTEGADSKVITLNKVERLGSSFGGEQTEYESCGACGGSGQVTNPENVPCGTCNGGQPVVTECGACGHAGEEDGEVCSSCGGTGVIETTCPECRGWGEVPSTELLDCEECGGAGMTVTGYVYFVPTYGATSDVSTVNGWGANYTDAVQTDSVDSWGGASEFNSTMSHRSANSFSSSVHQGGYPDGCIFVDYRDGGFGSYTLKDGTQKLKTSLGGDDAQSFYGYYIGVPRTHLGRLKWSMGPDGNWQMIDYASSMESLGQVVRTISPYQDTPMPSWSSANKAWNLTESGSEIVSADYDKTMPTYIPADTSAAGYRITSMTYTADWEGVKRLPDTITVTADGQQVGYTNYDYDGTETSNGQSLWKTTTYSYMNSASYLTSVSKVYDGSNVSSWLRGLPYSSQGPDGSKETVAYHRGTFDASTKVFTASSTGAGFRSVVLKGRANAATGATQLTTYDGVAIDPIYMITNVSTAEVTIRDARAFTVRTETLLYTGSGWALIDSADMEYDATGNQIRRQKLNGTLYEASYVNGQKQWDRDEQGLRTNYTYDTQGRVWYTVREAISGVPALKTTFTYDDDNHVLSTTVGEGETIVSSKTYDKSGRVLTETSEGLTTTYAYLVENGIRTKTTVTLPGGATRVIENYRDGRVKSITGTAALAEYYHYAVESGQEVVIKYVAVDNGPRWTKSFSDWAGHVVRTEKSSTEGSLVSTSTYNAAGQLAQTQTDTLAATVYSYDGNGVLNRTTQSDRVNSFAYGYTHDGNVWSRYSGDTGTWWDYSETLAYPTNSTDGQVQTRTWTRVTNFAAVSGPSGVTGTAIAESVAADANGNRAVTQTFLDRSTGTVTTVVWSPFATQPSISRSIAGRLVEQTSSAGVTVSYSYDALGRPISTTDRTGTSTVSYYSNTSRLHTVTDSRGVTQHTYGYDSAGRLSQDQTPRIVDGTASGTNSSYFAYNARGQLTHVWGDVPYPVMYEYDAYGDRTGQYTYRDAATTWSTAGLAGGGWPATGDKTSFNYYASNGLLQTKTDAKNKTVSYTYNPRGQIKTRTWSRLVNGQAVTTTYGYNDTTTGELATATYSDGTPALSYVYDRLGRLKSVHDAAGDRAFNYRSTDLKPLAELYGRNQDLTVTSHALGTTCQLTNQYDTTTGRFTGFSLDQNGSPEHALSYGFDSASARLTSIYSGAGNFTYSYTANSNLIAGVARGYYAQCRVYESNRNVLSSLSTASQAGTLAGYAYTCDNLGRRTSVDQTGLLYAPYVTTSEIMRTVYGYDQRNEVTSAVTTAGSTTLAGRSFGYGFDPIGNRTSESLDGTSYSYTPNELNQYTGRSTPSYLPVTGTANRTGGATLSVNGTDVSNWKTNYFYFGLNKTTPSAATSQSINFAITLGGVTQSETVWSMARPLSETFTYDDDGNLASDSLWVYAYDAENRLVSMHSVLTDYTSRHVAVFFAYDYMGRRISKDVLSFDGLPQTPSNYTRRSKTYFAWQGWTLIAEYDQNLVLQRRFTFGIDLSGSLGGAGDIGGLLAIEDLRSGYAGTYLAVHDGNGNLMALADGSTGALAAAYEYDPFGNVLRSTGAYGKENPFRFAGKYFDAETGLSYYGFRYYCASTGRFVNRDPLEERGGWNLYSGLKFAASNPFAGASGVEGTSWSTEWEQAQDRLLSNASLPHTTQSVDFDSKKSSGVPGSSNAGQKTYSANATGHYAQGGAPGAHPAPPSMSGNNPAAGNADINLYCYAGNNPINATDPMGLAWWNPFSWFGGGKASPATSPRPPEASPSIKRVPGFTIPPTQELNKQPWEVDANNRSGYTVVNLADISNKKIVGLVVTDGVHYNDSLRSTDKPVSRPDGTNYHQGQSWAADIAFMNNKLAEKNEAIALVVVDSQDGYMNYFRDNWRVAGTEDTRTAAANSIKAFYTSFHGAKGEESYVTINGKQCWPKNQWTAPNGSLQPGINQFTGRYIADGVTNYCNPDPGAGRDPELNPNLSVFYIAQKLGFHE